MSTHRRTALVVCPGRGTYNASELGYLQRLHQSRVSYIQEVDRYRSAHDRTTVSELDGMANYSASVHTRGDNASTLINVAAYCDFLAIDTERFDIVAITGNSLGWYISLGCGQALAENDAVHLIDTMGSLMQESLIGGQIVYPLVDEQWRRQPQLEHDVRELMRSVAERTGQALHDSIELGGMLVIGGEEGALSALMRELTPVQERYPMRLRNHAAFHTPLQHPVMERARRQLEESPFRQPAVALVDGRGHLWQPHSTDTAALWDYTLGHQLVEPYRFTTAVEVAMKEFAPDCVIALGPGNTLGGAVAQCLVGIGWQGIDCKQAFLDRQKADPLLLSMGLDEQREQVTGQ